MQIRQRGLVVTLVATTGFAGSGCSQDLRGVPNVNGWLDLSWWWLSLTLLWTMLALGFLTASQHFFEKRFPWLLSASFAGGLAIAAFYNLIVTAATPAAPIAGFIILIAIVLFARDTVDRLRR
jgi:hypothetical protein